jgi:hypothetical protein
MLARERVARATYIAGAGISVAPPSALETPAHLVAITFDALVANVRTCLANSEHLTVIDDLLAKVQAVGLPNSIGFEVFVRAIASADRAALTALFTSLNATWADVEPNQAHYSLAAALGAGGIVVTTNYDELIEAAAREVGANFTTVYDEATADDVRQRLGDGQPTSLLLKVHGTISRPESCLGALQDVGIEFVGPRRDLLKRSLQDRFPFFLGWRGADPDLGPALVDILPAEGFSIWTAYEGSDPAGFRIDTVTEGLPYSTQLLVARSQLLITEASRLCAWLYPDAVYARQSVRREMPRGALTPLNEAISSWSTVRTLVVLGDLLISMGHYSLARDAAALRDAIDPRSPAVEASDALQWIARLNAIHGAGAIDDIQTMLAASDTGSAHSGTDRRDAGLWASLREIVNSDISDREKFAWMVETIEASAWTSWPGFIMSVVLLTMLRVRADDDDSWALIVESLRGRVRVRVVGRAGRHSRAVARWVVLPYTHAVAAVSRAIEADPNAKPILLEHYIRARMYRLLAAAIVGDGGLVFDSFHEVDRLVSLSGAASLQYNWRGWRPLILRWAQDNRTAPAPFVGFRVRHG